MDIKKKLNLIRQKNIYITENKWAVVQYRTANLIFRVTKQKKKTVMMSRIKSINHFASNENQQPLDPVIDGGGPVLDHVGTTFLGKSLGQKAKSLESLDQVGKFVRARDRVPELFRKVVFDQRPQKARLQPDVVHVLDIRHRRPPMNFQFQRKKKKKETAGWKKEKGKEWGRR